MKRDLQGRYVTVTTVGPPVRAYVPAPLPPCPPIDWTPELSGKFDRALAVLGQLDKALGPFPQQASLLLRMMVLKEAVLSSMIEGTRSSLSDLLLFELDERPDVPPDDTEEVSHYVAALDHGLRLLEEGLPLSLRLLREIHGVLLRTERGKNLTPGEFRRSQNWIGGMRPDDAFFVPPPPEEVLNCMGDLERFLHDQPEPTPVLLKAALAHVQFETIHPFLDGNGRLGRLLITLLLVEKKVLQRPVLFTGLFFKMHRRRYYDLLDGVRQTGDWEAWLDFFADAVIYTAEQSLETAQQIFDLYTRDIEKIEKLGGAKESALRIHQALMKRPIVNAKWVSRETGITPATVNKALDNLERFGIVQEITGKKRRRLFSYEGYMEIMNRGTELPPG